MPRRPCRRFEVVTAVLAIAGGLRAVGPTATCLQHLYDIIVFHDHGYYALGRRASEAFFRA